MPVLKSSGNFVVEICDRLQKTRAMKRPITPPGDREGYRLGEESGEDAFPPESRGRASVPDLRLYRFATAAIIVMAAPIIAPKLKMIVTVRPRIFDERRTRKTTIDRRSTGVPVSPGVPWSRCSPSRRFFPTTRNRRGPCFEPEGHGPKIPDGRKQGRAGPRRPRFPKSIRRRQIHHAGRWSSPVRAKRRLWPTFGPFKTPFSTDEPTMIFRRAELELTALG